MIHERLLLNPCRPIPHFSVSIAYAEHGQVQVGAVYDPIRQELFSAVRGQGAFLNQQPIRQQLGIRTVFRSRQVEVTQGGAENRRSIRLQSCSSAVMAKRKGAASVISEIRSTETISRSG